jgi:flagellin-specific chaperone FliS
MSQDTADRVLALYDRALAGCAAQDAADVTEALLALIAMLDLEQATDVADAFHRLYSYGMRQALERRFDRVAWILGNLRETWAGAAFAERAAIA